MSSFVKWERTNPHLSHGAAEWQFRFVWCRRIVCYSILCNNYYITWVYFIPPCSSPRRCRWKKKKIITKYVVSFDLLKVQIPSTIYTCEKGAAYVFSSSLVTLTMYGLNWRLPKSRNRKKKRNKPEGQITIDGEKTMVAWEVEGGKGYEGIFCNNGRVLILIANSGLSC